MQTSLIKRQRKSRLLLFSPFPPKNFLFFQLINCRNSATLLHITASEKEHLKMAKMAFQHQAGTAMECLSIPITLHKDVDYDQEGREILKCGFKIGGGIDQDYKKSPQGYTDYGIYVTEVHEGSPAARAGLRTHDKILQCNGYDFTMVTHKKAVSYIRKNPVLNMLVARKGVTSS